MTLAGKTALITGGSRGIDRTSAVAFASKCVRVAFCHPGDTEAAEALDEIQSLSNGMAFEADISEEAEVDAFFDAATAAFGTPDILVNNAGILREGPLAKTSLAEFDQVISVNLKGNFLASRAFDRRSNAGRIINIARDLGVPDVTTCLPTPLPKVVSSR